MVQPKTVCQSCPMASQSGLPRWNQGRLRCGRMIEQPWQENLPQYEPQYECTMGFRVTKLSD
ncbi:hypothetical protein S7335_3377 [Synechococcus sp. PCC 7335]|uniref:hypothetical protein n=1 Tax=Synechococcus sp. (strain ATCC 29403 / PCC 7335) TaxID=91464 RepID=UPI00017EE748|nr:hypothetical protein [Synechococcus sp. PCC 7335]EDX85674.1 hypothetical protein S7335_3377 [Synechococcus sp. PCC 7335]